MYFASLILLISVEFFGTTGMGAQRWLNLSYFSVQPSELVKISVILALARYFHGGSLDDYRRILFLLTQALFVCFPAFLVLRQPDLGTALMLIMASAVIFFVVGVRIWVFVLIVIQG